MTATKQAIRWKKEIAWIAYMILLIGAVAGCNPANENSGGVRPVIRKVVTEEKPKAPVTSHQGRLAVNTPACNANVDTLDGARVMIGGMPAIVWASSTLAAQGSNTYDAVNAFDQVQSTAWVENEKGVGEGEKLFVEFDTTVVLDGFTIAPGYAKSARTFADNATPQVIAVEIDGEEVGRYTLKYDRQIVIEDVNDESQLQLDAPQVCFHTTSSENFRSGRVVVFREPIRGRRMALKIVDGLVGRRFADLAVSEFEPILAGGTPTQIEEHELRILRDFRKPNRIVRRTASDVTVDPLDEKYFWVRAVAYASDSRQRDSLQRRGPYEARIDPSEKAGRTADVNFAQYTSEAFLGREVVRTVSAKNETILLGARSRRVGDGEWLELYPFLAVGQNGMITRMSEATVFGSYPGCKTHTIPDQHTFDPVSYD